jgi:enoyl-CoA hydratase/carnithine racemase
MADTPEPLVLYQCRDRVATITFNRPLRLSSIAKNPPLGVRHTVQLRRWEMKKVQQEAARTVRAAKLNLPEDFLELARAFVEQRPARPCKGR